MPSTSLAFFPQVAQPAPAVPRPPYRFLTALALLGAALLTVGTVFHPAHADPGEPAAAFAPGRRGRPARRAAGGIPRTSCGLLRTETPPEGSPEPPTEVNSQVRGVETRGIEPLTPALQRRCSAN